jgi:hypothetical protein
MLQPVNLQLAHFNVEHSAQISKDAIAAAQQTAQGQEVVQESVKRTQVVQASLAAAEPQKVKRKEEDERERRQREQRQSFSEDSGTSDTPDSGLVARAGMKSPSKGFDFYA